MRGYISRLDFIGQSERVAEKAVHSAKALIIVSRGGIYFVNL